MIFFAEKPPTAGRLSSTRGIKHWGLSGYSNILPRIKFGVTGQESSPQTPTISYRQTLAARLKNEPANKNHRYEKNIFNTNNCFNGCL